MNIDVFGYDVSACYTCISDPSGRHDASYALLPEKAGQWIGIDFLHQIADAIAR
jgi:hypothetical protein